MAVAVPVLSPAQLLPVTTVVTPSIFMVCGGEVEGALPGPVAVNVTAYCPGPLNVCVGFARADVLFGPDAGSPKSQLSNGQSADVFVKDTVLLLVQE